MKLHGMAIAGVLAGIGCWGAFSGLRRAWLRAAQRRQLAERQLNALTAAVAALEARVAELSRMAGPAQEIESKPAAAQGAGLASSSKPKQETLAVIAAAATAFLGRAARIRSVQPAQAAETVSPWSQQGRVIVQTSHNLRSRE